MKKKEILSALSDKKEYPHIIINREEYTLLRICHWELKYGEKEVFALAIKANDPVEYFHRHYDDKEDFIPCQRGYDISFSHYAGPTDFEAEAIEEGTITGDRPDGYVMLSDDPAEFGKAFN